MKKLKMHFKQVPFINCNVFEFFCKSMDSVIDFYTYIPVKVIKFKFSWKLIIPVDVNVSILLYIPVFEFILYSACDFFSDKKLVTLMKTH